MSKITFDDFDKVDIRVGKIIEVKDFPEARKPAYQLKIDFGKYGTKRSSAQITHKYSKEQLMNRLILAVTNFPPKQIAHFVSEVLVLGVVTDDGVVLLGVDEPVELGSPIR